MLGPVQKARWRIVVGALLLATGALISAFFAANIRGHHGWLRMGIAVMAVGWGLNGAVIFANGGMPVPQSVLDHPPTHLDRALDLHRFEHSVLSPSTRLRWLADVVPVPCLPRVWRDDHRTSCGGVSAGDLLLVGGLAISLSAAMLRGPRRMLWRARHSAPSEEAAMGDPGGKRAGAPR